MFTLNLLGGAAFVGRDGPVFGRAAHKRRVALLAILAVARGRAVGREKLIGLLWPEHSSDAARHLLSESLYVLRKTLGADAFVSAGDEVGLNGAAVRSDVEEFEEAVQAGDLERAARVYRGPFLDGFYVADAPEFERWAEGERARLAAAHTRALECLAVAREGEGRPAEAAEWWRRLVVLDPYNSRVGARLMLALDAAGERAAALWFAETHTAFLRDELGVEPEDDFAGLVERLRTEPVRVPRPPSPSPVAAGGVADAAAAGGDEAPDEPDPPDEAVAEIGWVEEEARNVAETTTGALLPSATTAVDRAERGDGENGGKTDGAEGLADPEARAPVGAEVREMADAYAAAPPAHPPSAVPGRGAPPGRFVPWVMGVVG
ncbi:MAG TPA: BTAD domain-containing putative transcriptional regulator, partial [Longimicrobium sp.]|nr:BTAD domain-containing putative transcriptional regulator [Longimicrobium sp.]